MTPTGPRHPKLGFKWSCFGCDAKFYDLGKEEPICPKCGADQRDRPAEEPKAPAPEPPRPKVVRPMAQLLDDEEQQAPASDDDDLDLDDLGSPDDMFDEPEGDVIEIEEDVDDDSDDLEDS
ncbi:MAG TPA: FYDLN acid domain-containing protein [Myxococcota bacterium]|nr:FYDLN acid domain-containing protein [Myxococcota bacterium]